MNGYAQGYDEGARATRRSTINFFLDTVLVVLLVGFAYVYGFRDGAEMVKEKMSSVSVEKQTMKADKMDMGK